MGKKKRTIILSGTNKASEVYNIIGVIRMTVGKKIKYEQINAETHMISYKSTDRDQEDLKELFKKVFPNLKFGYLNERTETEEA